MRCITKIFILAMVIVFASGQMVYAGPLDRLRAGYNKGLDRIGSSTKFQGWKNKAGNIIGARTNPDIGAFVTSSRWRDVASFSGTRKASGILLGTAMNRLGQKINKPFFGERIARKVGGVTPRNEAKGYFHRQPDATGVSMLRRKGKGYHWFIKDKGGNVVEKQNSYRVQQEEQRQAFTDGLSLATIDSIFQKPLKYGETICRMNLSDPRVKAASDYYNEKRNQVTRDYLNSTASGNFSDPQVKAASKYYTGVAREMNNGSYNYKGSYESLNKY